jgi:hypothetical protein
MLLSYRGGGRALHVFNKLASEHGQTIYGRISHASLGIKQYNDTYRRVNKNGGALVWSPIALELRTAAEGVASLHPLSEDLLFRLACAQIFAGSYDDAEESVRMLERDSWSGKYANAIPSLRKELERTKIQKPEK